MKLSQPAELNLNTIGAFSRIWVVLYRRLNYLSLVIGWLGVALTFSNIRWFGFALIVLTTVEFTWRQFKVSKVNPWINRMINEWDNDNPDIGLLNQTTAKIKTVYPTLWKTARLEFEDNPDFRTPWYITLIL